MWFNASMPVPPESKAGTTRRVRGAGLDLSVTERGDTSQPTVLLVHGFPDTSAVWRPVAELLAADFHVVTYDVRGSGDSDVPSSRSDYLLPLLVDDLAAVADAVSPDAPVHLVAHDWGSIQGWEAVVTPRLAGRFASYTSISGPPLDHAALWARRHRTRSLSDLWAGLRQGLHSWYIGFFHLPFIPELLFRNKHASRVWAQALHRVEKVTTDDTWPAPTFGQDFTHGVQLYRANVGPRFRHPTEGHTETPVQIIVPTKDRYVTPSLLEGLETWSPLTWRREVAAGHWIIRAQPADVAGWARQVIEYVQSGTEPQDLAQYRVVPKPTEKARAA
jgi:pimeloyl-ACP methyl ester carboxylesterase